MVHISSPQNCLARVVKKSSRFCHIAPLLKPLHWLPGRYIIKFKLCSLTYQALTSGQPVYIRNMVQPSRKVRTLRDGSSDLDQLHVPQGRTAVGSRAFSVAVPRLWNALPLEILSAKTQICFRKKLYFFGRASPSSILGGPVGLDDNANSFRTMSQNTNMIVAPLSSVHQGFSRYRSLLLLLLLILLLL